MSFGFLCLCLWLLPGAFSFSQENYHWTHYTTVDGLSQNAVTSILQDRRGFMWFATWNGLSRFDGYQFSNFKVKPGDEVDISSSRIDYIAEDKYGFIWLLTYGKNVCRFDPMKEEFANVPSLENEDFRIDRLITLPGGATWLLTADRGAFRVVTDTSSFNMVAYPYSLTRKNLATNKVHDVFQDNGGNEWILTNNGIGRITSNQDTIPQLFFVQNSQIGQQPMAFFVAADFGEEIWFGADKGNICIYDKNKQQFSFLKLPSKAKIIALHLLSHKECLIATDNDGLFVFNGNHEKRFVYFSTKSRNKLKSDDILFTYQDSHGDVWIQQDIDSLARFNKLTGQISYYDLKGHFVSDADNPNFMAHEDINQTLWIHPLGGGIFYFDRKNDQLVPFFGSKKKSMHISDRLHSMYSDYQGNLWMSTRAKGLEKFVFPHGNFNFLIPNQSPDNINDNHVRAVAEDHQGRIWIATKSNEILIYDSNLRLLGFLGMDGKLHEKKRYFDAPAYSLVPGRNGVMWIGTKGEGLIMAVPGTDTKEFAYSLFHYKNREEDLYSLSNNNVYHIFEDAQERLWIATLGGGINLVEKPYQPDHKLKFINYRNHFRNYPIDESFRVRFITYGPQNKIWAATTKGVVMFDANFEKGENLVFNHFTYIPGDSSCLSNNDVHDILWASNGDLYFATFGGGLNRLVEFSEDSIPLFEHFTVKNGLPSDVLLALQEDSKGNIWITTENGLSRFNPQSKTFQNYNKANYFYEIRFSEAAHIKDSKGKLWFGSQQGVLWFHPDMLSKSSFVPPLRFTEFRLFNRIVEVGEGSPLPKPIDVVDKIVLKHSQNIFSIGFAALDMKYPQFVKYAVKLEGFDAEWRYIDHQRGVTYTNIQHGEYLFKVRSTNSDGVWVDNERCLPLIIRPSFWVTTWAYVIYIVLFLAIVFWGGFVLTTILRLRHKAELEHQLAQMKLDFFTNVSHELRTPLTLINGPLEEVLKQNDLSVTTKERLYVIKKNSDRMLRLIDQVLDFVKIHHKKMKLMVEQIDVAPLVKRVMDHFRFRAIDQKIIFTLENRLQNAYLWVDVDKFEKIIFNLLSNAFKYIDNGHRITVCIDEAENQVVIAICDDGKGISPEVMNRLFERFENGSLRKTSFQSSSGIGLAVVKEFVEMHHGRILVNSTPGEGTEFRLLFRKGLDHFSAEVQIMNTSKFFWSNAEANQSCDDIAINSSEKEADHVCSELSSVLLVEDNREVRNFIKDSLVKSYHVIEACNGAEARKKAKENQPDLIISDLMMPVMDGVTLLQRIRQDIETSHIPFIILTARTNLESKLQGLGKGADAYITKPFSTSYLMARVQNLLQRQRQLQMVFRENMNGKEEPIQIEPSQPQVTSMDDEFIRKLIRFMEKNMDNNELVVENLVAEMGVSRSVFSKKLKTLTGMAPIEFIRDMRMKRAAQLIKMGDYSISQVAFMVGMNDAGYFSRCFRSKFGLSPSQYKKRYKQ
ncbi:hybrid sensor histidine kinase/response regulator transcription factor [Thermophagus sp. OGC60D27]|uniref:hybrid sensor histidine kinase/response regulator transcription factor n=1 Tax=Thermophagus sp. OGC60D27 TaxID=3458415 RepID=UPI00403800B1